jgi:hypothetical protein
MASIRSIGGGMVVDVVIDTLFSNLRLHHPLCLPLPFYNVAYVDVLLQPTRLLLDLGCHL